MRKILLIIICMLNFGVIFAKARFDHITPTVRGNETVPPIVVFVPVSQNFNVNGCAVSISLTLAYVFHESTLQLQAVYVSGSVSITINCGTSQNYARGGNDVAISVDHDQVVDAFFDPAGDGADDILSDPGFQEDFVDMVNHYRPEP